MVVYMYQDLYKSIILSTTPVCVALFLNDNRIIPVVVVKEHFSSLTTTEQFRSLWLRNTSWFLNDNRIIPVVVVKEHFMIP